MPRITQINIRLKPVLEYDSKANRYVVYYEEFPQAIATGIDENDAEDNLAFLVEDMWQKRPDDLKK